jgi:multidrug efflux pump subunit AcrA (membrane-fusion protein)
MSLFSGFNLPDLISLYGCWAVFGVMLLESSGIPLPGETALILAAAYAGTTGELNIVLIVIAAATGAILGDNLGYFVGRRFGFPLHLRHGNRVGLHEGRLKLGQYLFLKDGGKARMVRVTTGIADDTYMEIKSGVQPGDEVISGSYSAISRKLKDGAKVDYEKEKK